MTTKYSQQSGSGKHMLHWQHDPLLPSPHPLPSDTHLSSALSRCRCCCCACRAAAGSPSSCSRAATRRTADTAFTNTCMTGPKWIATAETKVSVDGPQLDAVPQYNPYSAKHIWGCYMAGPCRTYHNAMALEHSDKQVQVQPPLPPEPWRGCRASR